MRYWRGARAVLVFCLLVAFLSPELSGQERERTKVSGTIVLQSGKRIEFDRLSPYYDLSGEFFQLTDDSADIEGAMPSVVKVSVGNIRKMVVGQKIVKTKRVRSTTRTVECEWLAVTLTLGSGEKVSLRAGTSYLSDAIVECGSKVMLYIAKNGLKREIDLLSVKEVHFNHI